jgi:hypothetical protein
VTDFASARAPKIATCSLEDLVSLDPADIISKLTLLFIVIIVLFGVMCIGGGIAWVMDAYERREYLKRLQTPEAGFRQEKGGAWIWRLHLEPLADDLARPVGTGVVLSSLLGMPLARMRAALPDELLSWDMGTALGRRQVLSTAGMAAHIEKYETLLPPLFLPKGAVSADDGVDGAEDDRAKAVEEAAAPTLEAGSKYDDFIGTALVLAFLQSAQMLPFGQLGERKSAAKRYFDGMLTPFGYDFDKTVTDFVTLVSPGTLNGNQKWLPNARLWRMIMTQHPEGFWAASDSVAFALEARAAGEVAALPLLSFVARVGKAAGMFTEEGPAEAMEYLAISAAEDAKLKADRARADAAAGDMTNDCPITCPKAVLTDSVPEQLRKVAEADADVDVERVWTTMLCVIVLQRMKFSWISGDGDSYPEQVMLLRAARTA